jgi:hypothetical protein
LVLDLRAAGMPVRGLLVCGRELGEAALGVPLGPADRRPVLPASAVLAPRELNGHAVRALASLFDVAFRSDVSPFWASFF